MCTKFSKPKLYKMTTLEFVPLRKLKGDNQQQMKKPKSYKKKFSQHSTKHLI